MFADTITLNLDGAERALNRISNDSGNTVYRYRTTNYGVDLSIRHSTRLEKGKSINTDRHNVEMTVTNYIPASAGVASATEVQKAYFVIEMPANQGINDVLDLATSISTFLTDGATLTKLVGWQS